MYNHNTQMLFLLKEIENQEKVQNRTEQNNEEQNNTIPKP